MKICKTDYKAKLFVGVMFSDEKLLNKVIGDLKQKFGELEEDYLEYDFDFTNYYEEEMGKNLKKRIIVFKDLINREEIADIKIFTNELEEKYSKDGKRQVNLDPGYFTKDQLLLPSAKESAYKVYLGKGVFGHLCLIFSGNKAIEVNRTFPDFRTEQVKNFFLDLKNRLPL